MIVSNISLYHVQGFDEFMNVVFDDAEEVYTKTGKKRKVGRLLLKGDNIALICNISEWNKVNKNVVM